ncbi:MAG TPA: glycosyltransferase [Albitalea sp.]|nr:glycosyltransferase [Albitalea sp.]
MKVLVFRSLALARSETFIKTQLLGLSAWHGVLVAERQVSDGLALDGITLRLLSPRVPRWMRQLRRRVPGWRDRAWPADVDLLRREQAQLMHVHFGTDALEAAPLARALGIPLLVTLHGFDVNIDSAWWESGAGGRLMRDYPARLRALAAQPRVRFVAVSQAVRERAIAKGVPPERVDVSHIGVDPRKIVPGSQGITERPPRVLYVGRLVEKKGGDLLIRAFAQPPLAGSAAELVMIGDGPLRASFEQLAAELKVPVRFLGSVGHEQVVRELGQARVYCLPSITADNGDAEGLNTTVLEAQAAGVPVVTSARASDTEGMIDGVTGLAFAERDVAALGAHLHRILSDDALAAAMSAAGPRFIAERFDVRDCTAALEAIYDKIAR